jgi:hypothetical protein
LLVGSNVLAPPLDAGFVAHVIEQAMEHPDLGRIGNIYGEDVSRRIVDGVLARAVPERGLFRPEEARLGLEE